MFLMVLLNNAVMSQEDSTEVFDYSKFGDAEGVKRFCTQKVLNQSAQRIVSIGYEYNGSFSMPDVRLSYMLPASQNFTVNKVSAIRAQVNIPVISTNKFIWQLGRSEEHTSELQSRLGISYAVFCLRSEERRVGKECV